MENCNPQGRELFEGDGWYFSAREYYIKKLIKGVCGRVLDVGCGAGMVGRLLPDKEVWGVDADPAVLKIAAKHLKVKNCPADQLDFPDQWFDTVTCFDVLEHVGDDLKALKEFYRVLKPSGVLYVAVPLHSRLWSPHDVSCGHYRRYDDIEPLLTANGFKIVRGTRFLALPYLLAPLTKKRKTNLGRPVNQLLCKWVQLEEIIRGVVSLPGLTGVYVTVKEVSP